MCTPYLDDLRARVLKTNESIRSTRLKCVEVQNEKAVGEQREPILFTAKQLTNQVLQLALEIDTVVAESSLWNSTTSKKLIAEFQEEASNCRGDLLKVVDEALLLRKEASALGVCLDEFAPSPELTQLRDVLSNELAAPAVCTLVHQLIDEYETSEGVREKVLEAILSFKPTAFSCGPTGD